MMFSRKAVAIAVLAASMGPASAATPEKIRVIVTFAPGNASAAEDAAVRAGGEIKHRIFGADAFAIEIPLPALSGLENNPNVIDIEEDAVRLPFRRAPSTLATTTGGEQKPYGVGLVQADDPVFLTPGVASSRKICIIDSGYDGRHEDLRHDAGVTGENDPLGSGAWDFDDNHHGTHVAGTIAGIPNNGVGVVGVAPNVKLHIIKVFDKDGWAYASTLTTAANRCKAAGANIISMSLGGAMSSNTEKSAFASLLSANVLPIAAAGNDGNSRTSYPAGYPSVMSVAALDQDKAWATFSQYNKDVEIAAPGVAVLSSVQMGAGSDSAATVGGAAYDVGDMDGSAKGTGSGALADFGTGESVVVGSMSGRVCLISRGTIEFGLKVTNCEASGGVGAIIYNNVAGGFSGTMGTHVSAIPAVTASDTQGSQMKGRLGQSATVTVTPSNYAYYDGTSMATPHVSAVAALVWSFKESCSATQLRNVLNVTALDLGAVGRDTKFGYGLVQAKAARDRLLTGNCGA